MSILAHSTYGAPGFDAEKNDMHKQVQIEIQEAKNIQRKAGCNWTAALKQARFGTQTKQNLKES